jgi:gamma-glutamyltranspeptidase
MCHEVSIFLPPIILYSRALDSIYLADERKTIILDARETAPASASQDMFVGREINATIGPLATATPAEVMGLFVRSYV